MLFYYEDELKDTIGQLNYLLENKDDISQDTKENIKKLVINFTIDLHQYLKQNDYKTYENLINKDG